LEGNSGTSSLPFELPLSQPATLPVSARLSKSSAGTATGSDVFGQLAVGSSGFVFSTAVVDFAPGQTSATIRARITGDIASEADEDFVIEMARHELINAAFGNGVSGRFAVVGTILGDDAPASTRYLLAAQRIATQGVRRYDVDGTFRDTWNVEVSSGQIAGLCRDADGNVMVTRFNLSDGPLLFSRNGAPRRRPFGIGSGTQFFNHESCVVDAAGNLYIGQAGELVSPDTDVPILKFNPSGVLLDRFLVPTGARGTDWIELGDDACTLYYTSEDTSVRRYDVCTRTALPNLTDALEAPCFSLRRRANGEVLVACMIAAYRIAAGGAILATYPRANLGETNAAGLFALTLDPDGTSFWTAGFASGNVYRVAIDSGAVLQTFNAGTSGVSGLLRYDRTASGDVVFANGFE
jgi:hypothetical protein